MPIWRMAPISSQAPSPMSPLTASHGAPSSSRVLLDVGAALVGERVGLAALAGAARPGPRPRAAGARGRPSRGSAARRRRSAARSPASAGSRCAAPRRAARAGRRGRRRGGRGGRAAGRSRGSRTAARRAVRGRAAAAARGRPSRTSRASVDRARWYHGHASRSPFVRCLRDASTIYRNSRIVNPCPGYPPGHDRAERRRASAPEGAAAAPHDDDLPGRRDRRRPVRRLRGGDERRPARRRSCPTSRPACSSCWSCGCSARWRWPTRASGSFMEYCREALGDRGPGSRVGWLYWYFWAIVLAVEAVAGAEILQNWLPGIPIWVMSLVLMTVLTATNLVVGPNVRRVRVLVRLDQGRGDHRLHRDRRWASCSASAAATRPACRT